MSFQPASIDCAHLIFKNFPTEKHPDYQWKKLIENSKSMDITGMAGLKPIVEVVPNFMDAVASSPLFEMRPGNAELLFCGFDIDGEDAPSMQLKSAIGKYINSARFAPEYVMDNFLS